MSTKYKELAELNQEYVDRLRERKAVHSRKCAMLRRELDVGFLQDGKQLSFGPDELAEEGELIMEEIKALEDAIKREYEAAPYAATRDAGIAGFWREVGGRL